MSWSLLAAFIGFHVQGLTQWNFGDAEVAHNVVFFWALAAAMPYKKVGRPCGIPTNLGSI